MLPHQLDAYLRVRARTIAKAAEVAGKLSRPPACKCGSSKVQMRHTDYAKPLQVVWLCPACAKGFKGVGPLANLDDERVELLLELLRGRLKEDLVEAKRALATMAAKARELRISQNAPVKVERLYTPKRPSQRDGKRLSRYKVEDLSAVERKMYRRLP